MSSRKGDNGKRRQKYQNNDAFKRDKWGTNERHKMIAATPVGAVCQRCSDKIEWKKKFDKYKPLSKPGRCQKCQEKTIRHAYHHICLPCGSKLKLCCMCSSPAEVIAMPLTAAELRQAELEEEEKVRNMRERDRRTYFRKMAEAEAAEAAAELVGDEDEMTEGSPVTAAAASDGGDVVETGGGVATGDESTSASEVISSAQTEPPADVGSGDGGGDGGGGGDSLDWEADLSDSEPEEEPETAPAASGP